MEHITPDQDWGVSGGVPHNVTVALKNGWLPTGGYSWQINSIGWVRGDRRDYMIAVLTAADPGEEYGIDTIEHISSLVFADLRPCRSRAGALARAVGRCSTTGRAASGVGVRGDRH
jgi:hypothetical protein